VIDRVWPDNLVGEETPNFSIALDVALTPELIAEGYARDVVRHVQQLRKDSNLDMSDRIHLRYDTNNETLEQALEKWGDYIKTETLSKTLLRGLVDEPDRVVEIGDAELKFAIDKAE